MHTYTRKYILNSCVYWKFAESVNFFETHSETDCRKTYRVSQKHAFAPNPVYASCLTSSNNGSRQINNYARTAYDFGVNIFSLNYSRDLRARRTDREAVCTTCVSHKQYCFNNSPITAHTMLIVVR